jgi:uncharacterized protein DUF5818
MRKTGLVAAILVLCAVWAIAQPSPATQSQGSQSQPGSQQQYAIEGCLASGSGGGFTLTDATGGSIQLAGASSELSGLVGKQVRVTGTQGSDSGPSTASSDKSGHGNQTQTLMVSKVEKIADSCSTSKK